jgi:hypothetical protein
MPHETTSDSTPPGSPYSREERSPDGRWRIVYDYMDGERTPLIVSPRVIEISTGKIIIDLWRSCLDGSVHSFTPAGFSIRVQDPFGPAQLQVTVDTAASTFTVVDLALPPRPLAAMEKTLHAITEAKRHEYRLQHPPTPPPETPSLGRRILRWLTDSSP